MVEALGIIIDRRPKRRSRKMENETIEKIEKCEVVKPDPEGLKVYYSEQSD
ncbi:hypothetical protein KJ813_07440 [bacterium]|nr:hypothetical protein [bacterium]MBU4362472.1 hypothetical protein [bacterium]MBU4602117.1 hypothetical protein [bacterium]